MLIITSGEPAGIGPDIILKLATQSCNTPWVVLADRDMLQQRARILNLAITLRDYHPGDHISTQQAGVLYVWHMPLLKPCQPGILNPDNAPYVVHLLELATHACLQHQFAGMITAPIHKAVINQAGIPCTGHTELLAKLTNTPQVVMLLTAPSLRVALATTHLPLAQVASSLHVNQLVNTIKILHRGLQHYFGIADPKIYVAGLNPHAGEQGYLGNEEITIIKPAIELCQQAKIQLTGPLPADTLFTPTNLNIADAFLAMYHDQGLPVLKYAGFGHAVNITLGLPIIRTSVDHGTALALAGTGQASDQSLSEALRMAIIMQENHDAYQYHRRHRGESSHRQQQPTTVASAS